MQKKRIKSKAVSVSLQSKIYEIMKDHIGRERGLTRKELLDKVFGSNGSYLQRYYDWTHKILPVMTHLRKRTKMFVISGDLLDKRVYFVMQRSDEQKEFEDRCERAIEGMHKQIERSHKALEQKWWKRL